jgi:hypothetical protein
MSRGALEGRATSAPGAALAELIQCHLMPHRTRSDAEAVVALARRRGLLPPRTADDGAPGSAHALDSLGSDPYYGLNALLYSLPELFEDGEAPYLEHEQRLLEQLAGGAVALPPARFHIEQSIELSARLPRDFAALHLWVPAPLHVPGVQSVELVHCTPARLRDHYLPEGGQLYNVPLLLSREAEVGRLELQFRVEQALPLRHCCQPLPMYDGPAPAADDPVRHWLAQAEPLDRSVCSAQTIVDRLVDRMEREFEFAVTNATRPMDLLLRYQIGDIRGLTAFLAHALSCFGIATRIGHAQRLVPGAVTCTLRRPGSFGYDHAYLNWHDPDSGDGGVVDLGYFRRWSFACTPRNTRSEGIRQQLAVVGEMGRRYLRRGNYPQDLVLAGSVPPTRLRWLEYGTEQEAGAPVDTTLVVTRLEAEEPREEARR